MIYSRQRITIAFLLLSATLVIATVWTHAQTASSHSTTKERAHVVFTHSLPQLNGDHLKTVLVEVNYGPGEASTPHSHPCPVVGYVVEGVIRTQVVGRPEVTVSAGESFYEAPNSIHAVSANASNSQPAKFFAYFVCDRDTPLIVDVPGSAHPGGK
jgi:quercetin dioxygenase-like cupin family protein